MYKEEIKWKQELKNSDSKKGTKTQLIFTKWQASRSAISIHKLKIGNEFLHDETNIQQAILQHYETLLKEEEEWRPLIGSDGFSKISDVTTVNLIRPFTEEEIRNVVFSMDPNKSPGPDGFSLGFYQQFWEVVKCEVMEAALEFQRNPAAVRCFNSIYVVLIPKKDSAEPLMIFGLSVC